MKLYYALVAFIITNMLYRAAVNTTSIVWTVFALIAWGFMASFLYQWFKKHPEETIFNQRKLRIYERDFKK